MSSIDDWLELMADNVTVEPFVSLDAYGKATYGTAKTYPARVDFRTRHFPGNNGEMRAARGKVWLATVDPISTRDKITLSTGVVAPIALVEVIPDENGPLYTSFMLE